MEVGAGLAETASRTEKALPVAPNSVSCTKRASVALFGKISVSSANKAKEGLVFIFITILTDLRFSPHYECVNK